MNHCHPGIVWEVVWICENDPKTVDFIKAQKRLPSQLFREAAHLSHDLVFDEISQKAQYVEHVDVMVCSFECGTISSYNYANDVDDGCFDCVQEGKGRTGVTFDFMMR